MPGEMLALKSHDVLDQELLFLGGHSNEPSMQPVRSNVMGFDEVHPEDLNGGCEENLVRETYRERKEVTGFI